ncbi:hypothetical protein DSOL_4189 [Desulfosporosinus metallidurans]|uniref:Uncharacterized protein n=1 Tax=Desulfosporosinus metallidurans TaxID=1888891 RepID=A0A1Q8QLL0_9FIRM|nr:hypothetical protein DSOL_4189 [Desulfosporosinus metallidurans]
MPPEVADWPLPMRFDLARIYSIPAGASRYQQKFADFLVPFVSD